MKKNTPLLFTLCAALLCSLAGCGGNPPNDVPSDSSGITQNSGSSEQVSPVGDFEYTEDSDNGITITKYTGNDVNIVIPEKIDGKNVTQIGKNAFAHKRDLTSVKIPETVTIIGSLSFDDCPSLTTVNLPPRLTSIKNAAFNGCSKLTDITLPETLTEIGGMAFADCSSLTKIKIPKSVTAIKIQSFLNCSGMEEVVFEDGLQTIGENAFACSGITNVVLPASVREISNGAFGACPNLTSITLNEGLVTLDTLSLGGQSKLTEVVIPASVKNINERTFSGCNTLKSVKFQGDAPENYIHSDPRLTAVDVDYTIYYHSGAKGFTSPEWNGYKTQTW